MIHSTEWTNLNIRWVVIHMRIDAFHKISQLYQMNSTKKVSKISGANSPDSVQISRMGKEYQIAKQAVAQTPDIREEKVEAIKERIASGTYDVSANELADKLINNFFDQSI